MWFNLKRHKNKFKIFECRKGRPGLPGYRGPPGPPGTFIPLFFTYLNI